MRGSYEKRSFHHWKSNPVSTQSPDEAASLLMEAQRIRSGSCDVQGIMHEAYASGSLFTLDDALHCVFRPTGSIGPLPEQLISQAIHTTEYPSYNVKANVLGVMPPSLRANEQILSFVTVH